MATSSTLPGNSSISPDLNGDQAVVALDQPSPLERICTLADPRFEENESWRSLAVDVYTGSPNRAPEAYGSLWV
jgi:hypothetical protein